MDLPILGVIDVPWIPLSAAVLGLGLLTENVRRRRAERAIRAAEEAAARDRDRAERAERDLDQERTRTSPGPGSEADLVAEMIAACRDLSLARDRESLAKGLSRAVERVLEPSQYLVFLAVDREGHEFHLAAAGGRRGAPWAVGARLNDAMGRIGLVARQRVAMDARDFAEASPTVREHLARTEPAQFDVEVAVPVVFSGNTAAVIAVGGPTCELASARAALELLAVQASSVLRSLEGAARIARLMNTDPMTGLGSKGWFVAEGSEIVFRSRADDAPAALVSFAIDDFRGYVARAGHAAGDDLLRRVAESIGRLCPPDALIARWAGAEFMALLPGATPSDACRLADRVRAAVAAEQWPGGSEQPGGRLTISAGAAFLPANGESLDALIEAAADALWSARWTGDATRAATKSAEDQDVVTAEIVMPSPGSDLPPPL